MIVEVDHLESGEVIGFELEVRCDLIMYPVISRREEMVELLPHRRPSTLDRVLRSSVLSLWPLAQESVYPHRNCDRSWARSELRKEAQTNSFITTNHHLRNASLRIQECTRTFQREAFHRWYTKRKNGYSFSRTNRNIQESVHIGRQWSDPDRYMKSSFRRSRIRLHSSSQRAW